MEPASAALGEALGLRRGGPLAEFTHTGFFDAERAHLDELTLVAIESRAGADLGLGRHGELAGELEAWCRQHPLRERLWELLILALCRSGRQAESLRAYAEIHDRLVDGSSVKAATAWLTARIPAWSAINRCADANAACRQTTLTGYRRATRPWPRRRATMPGRTARVQ